VVFHDLDEALAAGPELVVVSNPTALHLPVALAAVRAGCHVLVEKPLSHNLEGCSELAREAERAGVFVGVAYNLRFHPLVQRLRKLIQGATLGAPLVAHARVGGYLPAWHPWEDYRRGYAARRELGGGAALTNSHEIDLVLWLLGPAAWSAGAALGRRPLGTDVDEASVFCIRHRTGAISTVGLSLVERVPRRTLVMDFEQGSVELDLLRGRLAVLRPDRPPQEETVPEGFDFDQTYAGQIRGLLEAVAGRPSSMATLNEGVEVLHVVGSLDGLEKTERAGAAVN